ncbi:MAG: heparinase II/III-family protein, partial [Fimbriimonadaceae bacterium]
GANVLALHGCDYTDFRPIIAATLRSCLNLSPFPPGPWDELSEWFGLSSEETKPVNKPNVISSQGGGYYALTKGDWLATVRCHTYKDRPAHADMLHVDLWYSNEPIFIDGGTYSYNDPDGMGDYFKSTEAHNCVMVSCASQMIKGSRFLWLDWTKSKLLDLRGARESRRGTGGGSSPRGSLTDVEPYEFDGEHFGYRSRFGVTHRRHVTLERTYAQIVDTLICNRPGQKSQIMQVTWRSPLKIVEIDENTFAVGNYKVELELPEGASVAIIDEGRLAEYSTCYGELLSGYALKITWKGANSILRTRIKPLSERESELDPPEPRRYMEEDEPWPRTGQGRPKSAGPKLHP